MSALFSPLPLRGLDIRNRLWVSPMCQYSATDGVPNEWHLVHLAQFASGGTGLVVAEATAVEAAGRISPEDVGIWNDAQAGAWEPIVRAIHASGAAAGIQLAHAGRKASTYSPFAGARGSVPADEGGWPTVAPSALAYDGFAAPRALSSEEASALPGLFADAARRAVGAGFDVVEVHAAHGYLLHQFLSPLTNHRSDAYGGDLAGRARLLRETVRAVRAAIGEDTGLFVRFSATDAAPGGWDVDDTIAAARWVREDGADLIDVSSGGLVPEQRITPFPGYQVDAAARIRAGADMPVAAVGIITDGEQAQAILDAGRADAIFAGREWLRDPHFALRAAHELGAAPEGLWPPQYERAMRR